MKKKIYLLNVLICFLASTIANVNGQSLGDYRSKASGNWNSTATWETFDGSNWVNASVAPAFSDGAVTIISPHTVTITDNTTIDQVTVNSGATLTMNSSFTLNNGSGDDITANGLLKLNSGTINGNSSSTIVVSDSLDWAASGTQVRITVSNNGRAELRTTQKIIDATFTNDGRTTWSGGRAGHAGGGQFYQQCDFPDNGKQRCITR